MGGANLDFIELLGWLGHDVFSVDLSNRQILHVSPTLAARLGTDRASLEGAPLDDASAQKLLSRVDARNEGDFMSLLDAPIGYSNETRVAVRTLDGVEHWRRLTMRIVEVEGRRRLDVVGQDATEMVRVEKARATADLMRALSEAVHTAADLPSAAAQVAERLKAFFEVERCVVVSFDQSAGATDAVGAGATPITSPGLRVKTRATDIEELVRGHGRVARFDALSDAGVPLGSLERLGVRSFAYATIGRDNALLGVLAIAMVSQTRHFFDEELTLLSAVADLLAGPLAQKVLEVERRRAEEESAHARERLRSALDASGVGIWELDLRTNRANVDARCCAIWELDPEQGFQRDLVLSRIHPDDLPMLDAAYARASDPSSDGTYKIEYRYLAPGGLRHVTALGRFERDATGQRARVIGTLQDVSESRRLEAKLVASQQLESLGVLAGGIAHDFNNLLVGILGNANLAKLEIVPTPHVLEALDGIETAAQRASELTRQLLAYAGKGRFVVTTIDLAKLVEEMGHLLTTVIAKGVDLRYHFEAGRPLVRGDATQLRQVVMNLITNASDAIDGKSGVVTISTRLVEVDRAYLGQTLFENELAPGPYVVLQVSDSGAGMSTETQRRIFEPFFSTKFTGRGLGLAAVSGILQAHRGAMKVYSEVGRGTTFKVLLPAAGGTVDVEPAPTPRLEGPATGCILVVDDEEAIRNVTKRILSREGYQVLIAADGVEGVTCFREHHRTLRAVILDMTMPRMGGEEAFRRMRQIDSNVPIILSSGYSEQDAASQFRDEGLAGFVEKPFRAAVLLDKLRDALSH